MKEALGQGIVAKIHEIQNQHWGNARIQRLAGQALLKLDLESSFLETATAGLLKLSPSLDAEELAGSEMPAATTQVMKARFGDLLKADRIASEDRRSGTEGC